MPLGTAPVRRSGRMSGQDPYSQDKRGGLRQASGLHVGDRSLRWPLLSARWRSEHSSARAISRLQKRLSFTADLSPPTGRIADGQDRMRNRRRSRVYVDRLLWQCSADAVLQGRGQLFAPRDLSVVPGPPPGKSRTRLRSVLDGWPARSARMGSGRPTLAPTSRKPAQRKPSPPRDQRFSAISISILILSCDARVARFSHFALRMRTALRTRWPGS